MTLPAQLYSEPARVLDFYERLLSTIASSPAVESAGLVTNVPLAGMTSASNVTVESPAAPPREQAVADRLIVTPGYFRALGIDTVSGRSFTDRDVTGAPRVAIVNEAFARQHWPGMNPIGRRFRRGIPSATLPWMTVVGVVDDVKHDALEAGVRPTFYLSFAQDPTQAMTLLVRSGSEPSTVTRTVEQAMRAVDPNQPVGAVRTLGAIHMASMGARRLPAIWFAVFAALACLLAAAGVYGLVAYSVAARTREFGVRLAIGATPARLLRSTVWDGVRPVLVGAAAGAVAAGASADVLSGLLFRVRPRDTASFLAAVSLPLVTAVLASYLPAPRRTHCSDRGPSPRVSASTGACPRWRCHAADAGAFRGIDDRHDANVAQSCPRSSRTSSCRRAPRQSRADVRREVVMPGQITSMVP